MVTAGLAYKADPDDDQHEYSALHAPRAYMNLRFPFQSSERGTLTNEQAIISKDGSTGFPFRKYYKAEQLQNSEGVGDPEKIQKSRILAATVPKPHIQSAIDGKNKALNNLKNNLLNSNIQFQKSYNAIIVDIPETFIILSFQNCSIPPHLKDLH